MLELPEVLTMTSQLQKTVIGKEVSFVLPPVKEHKFCWFNGDPADYNRKIAGQKISTAEGFGIFVELGFENGQKLCINDGVNVRIVSEKELPKNYQLALILDDGHALVFSVAMYGGIYLHQDDYENEYYLSSKSAYIPGTDEFQKHYDKLMEECRQTISAKAFLATEQRFPGIGNGVLQDSLFEAKLHPKRKIQTLDGDERKALLKTVIQVLNDMTGKGGRDTEKDLFGNAGGYQTRMSKNTLKSGCPVCGGQMIKEAYMGGSVYFCPACQLLK